MLKIFMTEKDKDEREQSRQYICDTHDLSVESLAKLEVFQNILSTFKTEFGDHIDKEDTRFDDIVKLIEDRDCPLEEMVAIHSEMLASIKNYNEKQNGHVAELAKQGEDTTKAITDIANKTEAKSMIWKDIRVWAVVIFTVGGVFLSLIFGLLNLLK